MNRILLFMALCAAACFSTGCGAFLQTSYKIYEIRALYYFPDVYQATADCKLDGKMYLKCPLLRYTQKNSWFFVVITPTMFGDEYHVFHSYAGPDEYVWIQKEENEQGGHSWYQYDPAAMPPDAELEKYAEKRSPNQREGVPEYDCGSAGRHFYSGVDDSKPRVPQIRTENGFWWTTLAVLDGILIDFPVSLVMTLTGSFWYIPLTYL